MEEPPLVLVPKPDGSVRFCIYFRKLNEASTFDAYPMPRVDDLVDRFGKTWVLSTIDLTKDYWKIPLAKGVQEKTAFATLSGLYNFLKMSFRLQGAAALFQRVMDQPLMSHKRRCYIDIQPYMESILGPSMKGARCPVQSWIYRRL